jgi:threonine/homoserine/homoserine lactone efflux protein
VAEARQVGWRKVLIVAAVAVGIVLAIDVVTTLVPGLNAVVTRTPLFAILLIAGTAWLLWRIATRRPPEA